VRDDIAGVQDRVIVDSIDDLRTNSYPKTRARQDTSPASRHELLLHLTCGRDGRRGTGHCSGGRVDDGDGSEGALRERLMDLGLRGCRRGGEGRRGRLVGRWVGRGRGREEDVGRGLELVLEGRGVGRAAGQGGTIRG
jgi:hypothetical protein